MATKYMEIEKEVLIAMDRPCVESRYRSVS